MKKILITGINGSAGSYLCEYILTQPNVEIFGTVRNHASLQNIESSLSKINLVYVDMLDFPYLLTVIDRIRPDVIFHIASMANVRQSFDSPSIVINNNVNITLNILEAIKHLKDRDGYNPVIQICSTSEVYGNAKINPITENCPLLPINPYAASNIALAIFILLTSN
jgi:GDP-D-mannose dehydratase